MSDTVFGAPIRLGVTGLARSGKTVFIASLIANLLSGAKLPLFAASAQDRIELAYAGSLPENAQQLLRDIPDGRSNWLSAEFTSTPFAPPVDAFHPDRGIAHIRLDQSLEFLLGDRI